MENAIKDFFTPHISIIYKILGLYTATFVAVILDLISGIRKSRLGGTKLIHSYGLKKTVNKLAKYYNILLAFSVVDAITIISGIVEIHGIPLVPYCTFAMTFILCVIEGYSIWEKDEDKGKYIEAAKMTKNVIDSVDLDEIANKIMYKLDKKK